MMMKWNKYPETKPLGNINALVIFDDAQCPYYAEYSDDKWWCEAYCWEEMRADEVAKITHYLDIEEIPVPKKVKQ